jgi:hypothetical protein
MENGSQPELLHVVVAVAVAVAASVFAAMLNYWF